MPRTKKAYDKPIPNEWVQPIEEGYKLACCDCGLVHEMDFRVHEGRPQFRVRRNDKATSAMRLWKVKKGEGLGLVVGKKTKQMVEELKNADRR